MFVACITINLKLCLCFQVQLFCIQEFDKVINSNIHVHVPEHYGLM